MTPTPHEPDFMEWIEITDEGWKLKENAPEEVKKKYKKWEKELEVLKNTEELEE